MNFGWARRFGLYTESCVELKVPTAATAEKWFGSTNRPSFHETSTQSWSQLEVAALGTIIIGPFPHRIVFQAFSTSTTTPSRRARLYGHIYSQESHQFR
jgi:hypothetical protein